MRAVGRGWASTLVNPDSYEGFLYADAAKTMDAAVHALSVFAEKSGPHGMLGGQSVDVLLRESTRRRKDLIIYTD